MEPIDGYTLTRKLPTGSAFSEKGDFVRGLYSSRMAASLLALIVALVCPAGVIAAEARSDFVRVDGAGFVLDGKPFRVAGVNNHYLTFASEQEVIRVLDDAVAMGANVVRIFLQPVIGSPDGSIPTIWDFASTADSSNLGVHGAFLLYWNTTSNGMAINDEENGMRKVDFVVAEAARRGLRLYVAFLDFWAYTGGAQQMNAWYGVRKNADFFFADSRTRANYRAWVSFVIGHKNHYTGVLYRDDPTIFAWDLMNEPAATTEQLRISWTTEMSAFVKVLDRNHLVSSGSANMRQKLSDISIPSIDFGSWHGYPQYYKMSERAFEELIADNCAIGAKAGKPVVLSEFGLPRSDPNQATTYSSWLNIIDRSPGCAGWLVWRLVSLQDHGRYPRDDHDQFDIHNDKGAAWVALKTAAARAARD